MVVLILRRGSRDPTGAVAASTNGAAGMNSRSALTEVQICRTNRLSLQASQKGFVSSLGTGAGLSSPGIVDMALASCVFARSSLCRYRHDPAWITRRYHKSPVVLIRLIGSSSQQLRRVRFLRVYLAAGRRETGARLSASALFRLFRAVFTSASSVIPHLAQLYLFSCLCPAETVPQPEHLCDMNFGATTTSSLPAHSRML